VNDVIINNGLANILSFLSIADSVPDLVFGESILLVPFGLHTFFLPATLSPSCPSGDTMKVSDPRRCNRDRSPVRTVRMGVLNAKNLNCDTTPWSFQVHMVILRFVTPFFKSLGMRNLPFLFSQRINKTFPLFDAG